MPRHARIPHQAHRQSDDERELRFVPPSRVRELQLEQRWALRQEDCSRPEAAVTKERPHIGSFRSQSAGLRLLYCQEEPTEPCERLRAERRIGTFPTEPARALGQEVP